MGFDLDQSWISLYTDSRVCVIHSCKGFSFGVGHLLGKHQAGAKLAGASEASVGKATDVTVEHLLRWLSREEVGSAGAFAGAAAVWDSTGIASTDQNWSERGEHEPNRLLYIYKQVNLPGFGDPGAMAHSHFCPVFCQLFNLYIHTYAQPAPLYSSFFF